MSSWRVTCPWLRESVRRGPLTRVWAPTSSTEVTVSGRGPGRPVTRPPVCFGRRPPVREEPLSSRTWTYPTLMSLKVFEDYVTNRHSDEPLSSYARPRVLVSSGVSDGVEQGVVGRATPWVAVGPSSTALSTRPA